MTKKYPDSQYFDDLEQQIYRRISDYEARKQRMRALTQNIAASVLILMMISAVFFFKINNRTTDADTFEIAGVPDNVFWNAINIDDNDMYALLQDEIWDDNGSDEDDALLYYLADDDIVEYDITTQK